MSNLQQLKDKQLQIFDDMLKGYLVLSDGKTTLEKPRNKIKSFLTHSIELAYEEGYDKGFKDRGGVLKPSQKQLIEANNNK